jgi:hypothetical protein
MGPPIQWYFIKQYNTYPQDLYFYMESNKTLKVQKSQHINSQIIPKY